MKVCVFGMGYVGLVTAAVLARQGHRVTGVETNSDKLALLCDGKSPIVETGFDALFKKAVQSGRLHFTDRGADACARSELSLVCVGTPVSVDGRADMRAVLAVVTEIASGLKGAGRAHVVAVRSTLPPGAMRSEVIPAFWQALGKKRDDIFLCFYPEFMREGSGIEDFVQPPSTPVGCDDDRAVQVLQALYEGWGPRLQAASIENAELVKYAANAWHALKVAFANEIGSISGVSGADGREVMRLFSQDRVLNISPAYLKPGFAFGGSCLSKDLRLLTAYAGNCGIHAPVLDSILVSNVRQLERLTTLVAGAHIRRALILGLTFKAGTDDVRESAAVLMAARLMQAGVEIRVFDPDVSPGRLFGASLTFLEHELPQFRTLLLSEEEIRLAEYDALVVTANKPQFARLLAARGHEQKLFHFAHEGEQ